MRAAHQLFDEPIVFADPLATRVIGRTTAMQLRRDPSRGRGNLDFRAAIVARSRFAEDEFAAAVSRGVQQCLIIGAGLDTFAYRNPYDVHVFEVDHSSTQTWKRRRFQDAGLAAPDNLTCVGLDLTTRGHVAALNAAGFDAARPCCVSMLGVVIYLPRDLVLDLVRFVASLGPGSSIVFDYGVSREHLRPELLAVRDAAATRAASSGETFITFLDPGRLANEARAMGFTQVDDLGFAEVNQRYFHERTDRLEMAESGRRLVKLVVESDQR